MKAAVPEGEAASQTAVAAVCHAGPQSIAEAVRRFVDEEIVPNEPLLDQGDEKAERILEDLAALARDSGLWGLPYPAALGGKVSTLEGYVRVGLEEGRSEHGPAIFGSESAVDVAWLHRHGNDFLRRRCLGPLVSGKTVMSYGMSEPDAIGSIPATLRASAVREGGHWTVNARKWFICRADRAGFVTVVARTRLDAPVDSALSLIVVPTDAVGFKVERTLDVFGRFQGQCEVSFTNVRVAEQWMLGQEGQGLAMMQQRLALGRVLRSIHWLGLGQRCFDLMCERIGSPRGELARLGDKQLMRLHVFEVHLALRSARALVLEAARCVDAGDPGDVEVNMAKVAASRALGLAADRAVQVFGAEGLTDATPLSGIYRTARATRIMDGTDEALISAVGRRLLSPSRAVLFREVAA